MGRKKSNTSLDNVERQQHHPRSAQPTKKQPETSASTTFYLPCFSHLSDLIFGWVGRPGVPYDVGRCQCYFNMPSNPNTSRQRPSSIGNQAEEISKKTARESHLKTNQSNHQHKPTLNKLQITNNLVSTGEIPCRLVIVIVPFGLMVVITPFEKKKWGTNRPLHTGCAAQSDADLYVTR